MACLSLKIQRREFAGLADAPPLIARRRALHFHEQVEPRMRLTAKIPAARPQIAQRQHAPKPLHRAQAHARDAQSLAGICELSPDVIVHDWPEFDMRSQSPIKRLTAGIADVARISL